MLKQLLSKFSCKLSKSRESHDHKGSSAVLSSDHNVSSRGNDLWKWNGIAGGPNTIVHRGSALHGLVFALSELVFVKLLGRISFHVVLEQQVLVSLFAFIFTTIGVIVNNDFTGMTTEAQKLKVSVSAYILVLVWSVITFHFGVLGATDVLFLFSTVLAGVLNVVRVPHTSIATVILLKDLYACLLFDFTKMYPFKIDL